MIHAIRAWRAIAPVGQSYFLTDRLARRGEAGGQWGTRGLGARPAVARSARVEAPPCAEGGTHVTSSFPNPSEYAAKEVPADLAGWESMYPDHFRFGGVREEWENRHFWYLDKIHAPYPLPPLDHIFQQAWQISLSSHTTRIFASPSSQATPLSPPEHET